MKTTRPTLIVPGIRARLAAAAAVLCVALALVSSPAPAQESHEAGTGSSAGGLTLQSSPPNAQVELRGSSELMGASPLDLGPQWIGRYKVTVAAPGYATAEGALYFPPRGGKPYALPNRGLLLHSLNFPGVPALTSRRSERGAAFLTVGIGGLGAVIRDHLEYRSNRDKADFESQDRAAGFRYARGRWAIYTGAVWAMSAIDNLVQTRVQLLESTPTQVTLGTPKLSRSGVLWRSALVSGAGQDYAGRSARGSLWLGGTLLAGAAYLTSEESHHRIWIKLARSEELLAAASPAETADRQADVDHFTALEKRSSRLVDHLILMTAAVYAANVIDAGIVPIGGGSAAKRKVSISAPVGFGRAEIALSYPF